MRALLLIPWLALGCARKPQRFLSPDFPARAPVNVAVLPFDNESNDLLAPEQLRRLAADGLRLKGYSVAPVEGVDEKLRSMGITDGGQLPAVNSQTLGEALNVEGLFYGVVDDFLFQNLGFILRRIVKVRLKLVAASTGETLWEDLGEGATMLAAIKEKEVKRLFAVGMAQKAAENMAKKPLFPESRMAVDRVLTLLPPPGMGPNVYKAPIPIPPPVYGLGEKGAIPAGPPPGGPFP